MLMAPLFWLQAASVGVMSIAVGPVPLAIFTVVENTQPFASRTFTCDCLQRDLDKLVVP
jgi:hypothetical protein